MSQKPIIHVVYSPHDLGETVDNDPCNRPQERKTLIIAKLKEIQSMKIVETVEKGEWELAYRVHDRGLVDFLRRAWIEWVDMHERRDPGFFADKAERYELIPAFVPFQVRALYRCMYAKISLYISLYCVGRHLSLSNSHTLSFIYKDRTA